MVRRLSPVALACCLALLTACGFEPVYGRRDGGESLLTQVAVAPIEGRAGQIFRASLEDKLNPDASSADARFELRPTLSIQLMPLSIEPDGTIARYRVLYHSRLTLYDRDLGKQVYTDTIKRSSSYDVSDEADYSSYVAEQDAIARGLDELSHDYFLRIAAFLKRYETEPGQGV